MDKYYTEIDVVEEPLACSSEDEKDGGNSKTLITLRCVCLLRIVISTGTVRSFIPIQIDIYRQYSADESDPARLHSASLSSLELNLNAFTAYKKQEIQ